MGDVRLKQYFERIGFSGSIAPNLATLQALHALHPASIPFENLSPLMGEPVPLDLKSLNQKLLAQGRGGYCFEHNLLFMAVLRELEYSVKGLAARVLWGHPEGSVRPVSHMVLLVEIGGSNYLADVGFGGMTLTAPIKLKTEVEQETPHETFRLMGGDPAYRLEVKFGEDWRPVYAFDLLEHSLEEYEALNGTISTEGRFVENIIAARTGAGTRFSLLNQRLTRYETGEEPVRQELSSIDEVKEVLADVFGISLPPGEQLDAALERVLGVKDGQGA